jgi:hypothetical protein
MKIAGMGSEERRSEGKTGEQEAGKDVGKCFTWQQGAKSGWEIEVYKH